MGEITAYFLPVKMIMQNKEKLMLGKRQGTSAKQKLGAQTLYHPHIHSKRLRPDMGRLTQLVAGGSASSF